MAWEKGKSRNLTPGRLGAGKALADLLHRAIDQGWRHPQLGVLSYAKVGDHFGVNKKTVHKWCSGVNLPPLWVHEKIRTLLKTFSA